eukprot:scaffold9491_cov150-Isochrysis_galbana.AAC.3
MGPATMTDTAPAPPSAESASTMPALPPHSPTSRLRSPRPQQPQQGRPSPQLLAVRILPPRSRAKRTARFPPPASPSLPETQSKLLGEDCSDSGRDCVGLPVGIDRRIKALLGIVVDDRLGLLVEGI